MPNFMKDWESADPYYAPYASFERSDKSVHSWLANASVGAFWATKFTHGEHDLQLEYPDLIDDDLGEDVVAKSYSVFPNYFVTGQEIRVRVRSWDIEDIDNVEFYANDQIVATDDLPPYACTYAFASGEEGMYAIYPVAVTSSGQRIVGHRRMVQVYPNSRDGNTAPTVSNIDILSGAPGETLSVPFLVGGCRDRSRRADGDLGRG